MSAIRVGAALVHAILEQDSMAYPLEYFFEGWDAALIAGHRALLVPDHIDPEARAALFSHHAWLVEIGPYKVLIDPCVGNGRDRAAIPGYHQLDTPWLDRLSATGVTPDDIDFVLCTHLHADHCGWNTRAVDGRFVPTFPNARYIFSRAERDFWARELTGDLPAEVAYNRGVYTDSVLPVIEAGLAWVVEGRETFADAFTLMPAPGHTIGQIAVRLDAGGDGALFIGDVVHSPIQILDPDINTAGNHDPVAAVASRRALLQLAADRNLVVAPGHFRGAKACRVQASGAGYAITWCDGSTASA
ncbi:MBL fold metallo-hydrolase [Sphingomonas immobilis]|uniref:MBL fold metallo-hydrolase n=1 Tax=Sphingomonas immobilis TaxID=3063997 RepID=A0ABT8ZXD9_9SPHN|nr:MBL fold metallo-hydrolase [Sphingomonas sp. CA1-15]MDO7842234.1 MBL fold metallo-hydrolase [Sphingomonas sp. CA1-15]